MSDRLKPVKNAACESSLNSVLQELEGLTHETRALCSETQARLEEQWFTQHAEIYPRLCLWKTDTKTSVFSTFDVFRGAIHFKPLLSDGASPQFPESLGLTQEHEALCDTYSNNASLLINLAMSSQEMQICFENSLVVVPFVFFERVCGILMARIPGLVPEHYPALTNSAKSLVEDLRTIVVVNPLAGVLTMMRAS